MRSQLKYYDKVIHVRSIGTQIVFCLRKEDGNAQEWYGHRYQWRTTHPEELPHHLMQLARYHGPSWRRHTRPLHRFKNKGYGYLCTYYGNPVLKASKLTDNAAGGFRGSGYAGHTGEAHESIVFGNRGVAVSIQGSTDWNFSRYWWGPASTQRLLSKGDAANLGCIKDASDKTGRGRVRLHDFLTAEPEDCGSSLTWKP